MLLALCLLGGASALADKLSGDSSAGATEVTYTIAENTTYELTISPDVTIDSASNKGEMLIELKAPNFNVQDGQIIVFLSGTTGDSYEADGGKFYLTNKDDSAKTILYRLYGSTNPSTQIQKNFSVLEWTCNGETTGAQETLTLVAEPAAGLPAGTYKDTLTFTVEIPGNEPIPRPEPGTETDPVAP